MANAYAAPGAGANGSQSKSAMNNKTMFAPGFTINVNANKTNNGAAANGFSGDGRGGSAEALLPDPDFSAPARVREYCNSLRAAAVSLSIQVAMGAEIMKGTLAAVPDPEGRPFGSRTRAAKVARKLSRSADALRDAAKNAAACYSAFQQEYEEEINRVRHRARRPQQPAINWAEQ